MSLAEPIAMNRHSATEKMVDFRESNSKNESTENVAIVLLRIISSGNVASVPVATQLRGEDAEIIAVKFCKNNPRSGSLKQYFRWILDRLKRARLGSVCCWAKCLQR